MILKLQNNIARDKGVLRWMHIKVSHQSSIFKGGGGHSCLHYVSARSLQFLRNCKEKWKMVRPVIVTIDHNSFKYSGSYSHLSSMIKLQSWETSLQTAQNIAQRKRDIYYTIDARKTWINKRIAKQQIAYPTNNYLFKVNNCNSRKRREIY